MQIFSEPARNFLRVATQRDCIRFWKLEIYICHDNGSHLFQKSWSFLFFEAISFSVSWLASTLCRNKLNFGSDLFLLHSHIHSLPRIIKKLSRSFLFTMPNKTSFRDKHKFSPRRLVHQLQNLFQKARE